MNGRVKTLHPRVHGALLARAGMDDADLARLGAEPIDLVAINLYPFEKTLASPGSSFEELIENIDIGGPEHAALCSEKSRAGQVVCDARDYGHVIEEMDARRERCPCTTRRELAAKAFAQTAAYDTAIAAWLSEPARSSRGPAASEQSEKSKRDQRFMSPKVVPLSASMPSGGRAFTFRAPHFGIPTMSRRR